MDSVEMPESQSPFIEIVGFDPSGMHTDPAYQETADNIRHIQASGAVVHVFIEGNIGNLDYQPMPAPGTPIILGGAVYNPDAVPQTLSIFDRVNLRAQVWAGNGYPVTVDPDITVFTHPFE